MKGRAFSTRCAVLCCSHVSSITRNNIMKSPNQLKSVQDYLFMYPTSRMKLRAFNLAIQI